MRRHQQVEKGDRLFSIALNQHKDDPYVPEVLELHDQLLREFAGMGDNHRRVKKGKKHAHRGHHASRKTH